MTDRHEYVYETPDMELIEISAEGILCASTDDSTESYFGDELFEKLF